MLPDPDAMRDHYLRVVDESGEDYLYPAQRFVVMQVSETVKQKLLAAASSVA